MGKVSAFRRIVSPRERANQELRAMLALFPDRATYEQWLTAREIDADARAHMEGFLPERLRAHGQV